MVVSSENIKIRISFFCSLVFIIFFLAISPAFFGDKAAASELTEDITGELCSVNADCQTRAGGGRCVAMETFSGQIYNGHCAYLKGSEEMPQRKVEPVAPVLQINIPTIQPFTTQGLKANAEGYAYIPFIGQYFVGIYKWAVMVGGLIAAIMIILGGFTYLISRGNAQQIEEAKSRITGAIFGLALLFGSYAMLYIINPDLVQFKGLKIQVIEFKNLTIDDETEEKSISNGTSPSQLAKIDGENIYNPGGRQATVAVVEKVKEAAKNLQAQGITLYITDGYRTVDQQKAQIAKKCSDPANAATCKPPVCMLINGDPKNCPHTTGGAVDLWGRQGNSSCIRQANECKTDAATDPCRQNPCQAAVIAAMKAVGFCNYVKEAWHFEFPKMSPCL